MEKRSMEVCDGPTWNGKGYSIWIYMGGGGGGNAHLLKKSWGEGVKIKKNHWARGLSNIEKHGAGATWQFFVVMLYFATSILLRTRIVQFWYVPELFITCSNSRTYQNCAIPVRTRIDYTILVHVFFQNCYYNSGTYQNCPWIIFLSLA